MRRVVVLEDEEYRIAFLRDRCGVQRDAISWCTTVTMLRTELAREPKPVLIILDHDLGEDLPADQRLAYGYDINGENGMAACEVVPLHIPILVWSLNANAGPDMAQRLRARGCAEVHQIPFKYDRRWMLCDTIFDCLSRLR